IKRVKGNWLTDIITRDNYYCMGDSGLMLLNLSPKKVAAPQVFISGINIMDESAAFMNKAAYEVPGETRFGLTMIYYTQVASMLKLQAIPRNAG
ncbi:MAG: hypothetical protein ABI113_12820, partial [Mucilaginibacter sp.]